MRRRSEGTVEGAVDVDDFERKFPRFSPLVCGCRSTFSTFSLWLVGKQNGAIRIRLRSSVAPVF